VAPEERSFGYLLRRYRLAALLTQEQLAERAHLSYRTISDLERGAKHTPRRDTVLLLADALQLSPQERAGLIAAIQPKEQQLETGALPVDQASSRASVRAFLIADLRGYTAFTEAQGDEAAAALTTSFAGRVRRCAEGYEGQLLEVRGDEVLVTFTSARQALRAAVQLQQESSEMARDESFLHVGIGLDAGEPIPVQGGYRGGALNLAARLCAMAGPGEIFASSGMVHLARQVEGLMFVDRGAVRLKGLIEPVQVIQIASEGALSAALPPLQPTLASHPTNLPDDPTLFIGREREIGEITSLLKQPHVRLVTLTGPGGTGKTRLALQVANTLLYGFSDGAFFCDLSPLADPSLVPAAMAAVLGIKEQSGASLSETLAEVLKEKELLLVLDNFEHLLGACDVVATLLDACRKLHVLVTSRIPLHLSREHEHAVPPLSVPDLKHPSDLAAFSNCEAVALFVERARAAKDSFALTDGNARVVAEICTRLDGLPLAIELAAVRIKLFPPQALLQRLSASLQLLTGGAKDRPSRQQTLRNTIEWSYSLLSPEEQALFARLSVFAGGCTLEAAEAVCQPEGEQAIEIVEGVTSLLDQSLLRELEEEKEPRFAMLETIREYAAERLEAGDQAGTVRDRHATYYLRLAEEAEPELTRAEQVRWLERLEAEHDNLRAALRRLLDAQQAEEALRLAGALSRFWSTHAHLSEGRQWLERALAIGKETAGALRAKAWRGAGYLAEAQMDYKRATDLYEESLRLYRELDDARGIARAVNGLGNVASAVGDLERAASLYGESLTAYRELGDNWGIAIALCNLAGLAFDLEDYERAIGLYEQGLKLFRELGDTMDIAESLRVLGKIAFIQGDYERAVSLYDQSLTLFRDVGDTPRVAAALGNLGTVALAQGDHEQATALYDQGLTLCREVGDVWGIRIEIYNLGDLAAARHEPERAARLYGAADNLGVVYPVPLTTAERRRHEQMLAEARQQLDEPTWTAAWEEGRVLSLERAIQYALGESVS